MTDAPGFAGDAPPEGCDPVLILRAAALAARAHAGQVRKGSGALPYVLHPLAVATMLAEAGADPDTVLAGILHDVIEDSDVTEAEIAREFGPRVAGLVAEVSDPPDWAGLPRPERKARQARHLAHASAAARMIKIADQTSNLTDLAQDPAGMTPAEHAEYREGAVGVVAACRGVSLGLEARFDAARHAHEAATG